MFIGGKLLLCFLLLQSVRSNIIGIYPSTDCYCPPHHPQEFYCRSKLVFLASFTGDHKNNTYTVYIQQTFKGDTESLSSKSGLIDVVMESECYDYIDTYTNMDEKYLFYDTKIRDGKVIIDKCSISLWFETNSPITNGVDENFAPGCGCWRGQNEEFRLCKWNYSYLKMNNSKCEWAQTPDYIRCQLNDLARANDSRSIFGKF